MARILRGDIVWADLNPVRGHEQAGRRPVVVISDDAFNEQSGTVIAMAITGIPQRAGFPFTLKIASVEMPRPSWIKISQIRTLSAERLENKIGQISSQELDRIVDGLNQLITVR